MLILGFNLAISSTRVCSLRSQSDSQFFCPVYEFTVNKGSTSVVHNRLRDSKRIDPILDSRDCSLSTSVSNWVYHQEARKCFNDLERMKISITGLVKRFFVIYAGCAKLGSVILPIFQWYFISVLGLWFVVLASQAISSECAYLVKHTRPVNELFCIVTGF